MRWRPLTAMQEVVQTEMQTEFLPGETLHAYAHGPDDFARSAALAEALARLEVATRLRDGEAVARILDGLRTTQDGQWLLRQCVAAGLREVAAVIADPGLETTRSAGAA